MITQKIIDDFKTKMSGPVKFGKNAGKPRRPENIAECAWAVFAGYPRPRRNHLTMELLSRAGFKKINASEICLLYTSPSPRD